MGLFRKKSNDAEHLQMMQDQLAAMRRRLDESDEAKAQLESRVGHLDAENQRLSGQVGDVEVQVVTVQGKVGTVEAQVGDVASHVGSVESQVGEVATKVGTVESQVGTVASDIVEVATKVVSVESQVGGVAAQVGDVAAKVDSNDASVDAARVDDVEQRVADQVAALAATVEEQQLRLADLALVAKDTAEKAADASGDTDHTPDRTIDDELRVQVGQIAEKMTALDGRVTQISVELTNQLTELGNELDGVNERGGDASAIEQQIESITAGQRRLANEQARYEIQFREDLAELVDRFRRPNAR